MMMMMIATVNHLHTYLQVSASDRCAVASRVLRASDS